MNTLSCKHSSYKELLRKLEKLKRQNARLKSECMSLKNDKGRENDKVLSRQLKKRIKELHSLYGISLLGRKHELDSPDREYYRKPHNSLNDIVYDALNLIKSAYSYPKMTCVRIVFEGKQFTTDNFMETQWCQSTDIKLNEFKVGSIDVYYLKERPASFEGPFSQWERELINVAAERIGKILHRYKIEKDLHQCKERFTKLFESCSEGIIASDIYTNQIKYLNHAICRMLGYTESDLMNMTINDIHPEVYSKFVIKQYEMHDFSNRLVIPELPCICKNDKTIFVNSCVRRINFDGIEYNVSFFSDITDLKKMKERLINQIVKYKKVEKQLRQSKERYRTLFATCPEGILVSSIKTMKIKYANPAICKILGYSSSELLNMHVMDMHPKKSHKLVVSKLEEQVKGIKSLAWKIPCTKKNGDIIYADINGAPFNIEGKGYIARFFTDQTEFKLLNDMLVKSMRKYKDLTETINDWVWEIDETGRYTYSSPRVKDFLGYEVEEILGKSPFDLMPEDEAKRASAISKKIANGNKPFYMMENVKLHKDGHPVYLEVNGVPVINDKGVLTGYRGISRDISEKKKREKEAEQVKEQLLRTDRLKSLGILVTGIAHEINNPNLCIMLNIPIIKSAWEDAVKMMRNYHSELKDYMVSGMPFKEACRTLPKLMNDMENSSSQIRKIVQDLKDYAIVKNRDFTIEICNLNNALIYAVNLLSAQIKKSTDRFSVKYGDLPLIKGDIRRLEQVVVNIIQNSCQALENKNKAIRISSYADDECNAVIEVRDEGVGISRKDIRHLTEPFFTTRREQGGTGLGLSISSNIISEHKGKLLFDSKAGKGTTVKIVIPGITK